MSTTAPMRNPSRTPFFTHVIHAPAAVRRTRPARRSALARRSARALKRWNSAKCIFSVLRGFFVEQLLDLSLHARSVIEAMPQASSTASILAAFCASTAASSAGATPARAGPSSPSRPSPGSDSTRRNSLPSAAASAVAERARRAKSPASASCVSLVISAGISFEATEIIPRPPSAISGIVIASSPLKHVEAFGKLMHHCAIWPMLPEASFTPTILSISRQALQRRRLHVHAGAPLHAIDNDRQRHRRGDRFVVLIQALLRGLVVVRRDGQNAVDAHVAQFVGAARSLRRCCIRPRPPAREPCPWLLRSVISTTRRCSARVSVGLSPVVPQGTRKLIPASICRRTSLRRPAHRATDLFGME